MFTNINLSKKRKKWNQLKQSLIPQVGHCLHKITSVSQLIQGFVSADITLI
jgi:hypothetical protein